MESRRDRIRKKNEDEKKGEKERWRWFRERTRVVKQRMEDLASWVALVGKASPLLPDKRWPWPMMWNGFDWLSLIPPQCEPRSSPGARSTTVTLSDISYFTSTTATTAGYRNSDLILILLNISYFTPATVTTVAYDDQSLKRAFFRVKMEKKTYNHH